MKLITVALVCLLSACTTIDYEDSQAGIKFKFRSFRPAGEALVLDGELFNKGKISVNREQGSTLGEVNVGIDEANNVPVLE